MGKHAFLILAHEREAVLKALLAALDDERCDVFLHIDAKASFDGSTLRTNKSRLAVLPRRIDACWGDFSLVEAELALMEAAIKSDNYDYLHLISGVDYPIHGVEYIIDFCNRYKGKEFIGFARHVNPRELNWRTGRRFLFTRNLRNASLLKRILRKVHAWLQSLPGCGRTIDAKVMKGPQWCSFTPGFARYVIARRNWIKKNFEAALCPDELVMQTLCWSSPFRESVFDSEDEFHGAMRYIPWNNACLKPLNNRDYSEMLGCEAFFGRKFTLEDIEAYSSMAEIDDEKI